MTAKDSPHFRISRRLRMDFREGRDLAHSTEISTLCLSAMSGNEAVDVGKINSRISEMLDHAFYQAFPYFAPSKKEETPKKDDYEEYFRYLNSMGKADSMEKHSSTDENKDKDHDAKV